MLLLKVNVNCLTSSTPVSVAPFLRVAQVLLVIFEPDWFILNNRTSFSWSGCNRVGCYNSVCVWVFTKRVVNSFLFCHLVSCRLNPSRGPWRVNLNQNIYQPFLEYCNHRMTRWNVWQAYNSRASISQDEQNLSNHIIIEDIRVHR